MSDKITLQKIFNLAWEHFIVGDGKPAIGLMGNCVYCNDDGDRCAIGLALPNHHPSLKFKGGFSELVDTYPSLFDRSVIDFDKTSPSGISLNAFQKQLHDYLALNSREWNSSKNIRRNKYLEVAKQFGLTVPNH